MLDQLIKHVNRLPYVNWHCATLHAINNLLEGGPMVKALIDIHCRYWDEEHGDFNSKACRQIHASF